MHDQDNATSTGTHKGRTSARKPATGDRTPLGGILALQATAGNAAAVQMLRAAGHSWAQEQHQHGAGCGHQQVGQPQVQRSAVHDVLRSGGRPLDDTTRTDMEARLGADFSDVRVHNDSAAKASTAEVGARAYTSGVAEGTATAPRTTAQPPTVQRVTIKKPTRKATTRKRAIPKPPVLRGAVANGPTTEAAARRSAQDPMTKISTHLRAALVALGWSALGANQSLTLHKATPAAADAAPGDLKLTANKSNALYGSSQNVRSPRKYEEGEKNRQALRWISTITLNYLKAAEMKPEEVQAAIHGGKLYISANRNAQNTALSALATSQPTGSDFVRALIAGMTDNPTKREARHTKKATDRLLNPAVQAGEIPKEFEGIIATLTGKPEIPAGVPGKQEGLHAERRIDVALKQNDPDFAGMGLKDLMGAGPKVTPDMIAGTKRPCVACYFSLYRGTGARPGPYWPSISANVLMENYSIEGAAALAREIDDAVTTAGGTFATLELQCKDHQNAMRRVNWANDTDSDSDAEPAAATTSAATNSMDIDQPMDIDTRV
ncbi:hypothetical protein BG418_07460 [Streptomyces sp. CBMA152]|nr:hypothetical protein [Streptomyces sp. CBMA152]